MPGRRRESVGVGQFGQDRPAGDGPAEIAMGRLPGILLPLGIAQRHLGIARPRAAGGLGRGPVEQAGMVQVEIRPAVVRQIARQQALDDVGRFREAFVTLARAGPALRR